MDVFLLCCGEIANVTQWIFFPLRCTSSDVDVDAAGVMARAEKQNKKEKKKTDFDDVVCQVAVGKFVKDVDGGLF